mmetsp:Transcript_10073/g.15262  ORF Transcript_10073/g.15262 Transcript_10073/m.15262 type:complete len:94 (+) Transcript_10073:114-395(+)
MPIFTLCEHLITLMAECLLSELWYLTEYIYTMKKTKPQTVREMARLYVTDPRITTLKAIELPAAGLSLDMGFRLANLVLKVYQSTSSVRRHRA